MPQALGSETAIVFDVESTYNTAPSPGVPREVLYTSEDLRASRASVVSDTIRSVRDRTTPKRANFDVGGSINFEVDPHWMGTFLHHAMGAITTTDTTGSAPYTHTFKIAKLPTGLTFEKKFSDVPTTGTDQYMRYSGCRINQLTMSGEPSGFITGSISLVGAGFTFSTSSYTTTSVTQLGSDPFDGFEASIKAAGAALASVKSFEFTLDNNLDDSNYTFGGGGIRKSVPEGKATVSGTITALFDSVTEYQKAVNYTTTNFEIRLTRGDGSGNVDNEDMLITIPEVKLEQQDPVIPDDSGIEIELPFTAFASASSTTTTSMQIALKNSTPGASYT